MDVASSTRPLALDEDAPDGRLGGTAYQGPELPPPRLVGRHDREHRPRRPGAAGDPGLRARGGVPRGSGRTPAGGATLWPGPPRNDPPLRRLARYALFTSGPDPASPPHRAGPRPDPRPGPLPDPRSRRLPLPLLRSAGLRTRRRAPRRPRCARRGRRNQERGQPAHGMRGVQPRQADSGRRGGRTVIRYLERRSACVTRLRAGHSRSRGGRTT